MDVRRTESLKGTNGEFIGSHTKVKIVKNKVAPPFKTAEFDIMFGEGISRESELVDMAVSMDIMKKSGAWFSYGETRVGQGRENTKQYLRDNPEIANEIEAKIREKIEESRNKTDDFDGEDEIIAYKPVATTKDEVRAKIDIIVDDE